MIPADAPGRACTVRAPGKVLLFGEYAVLDGAPNAALVAAVARGVTCEYVPGGDRVVFEAPGLVPPPVSGDTRLRFVEAAAEAAPVRPAGRYIIDSAELFTTDVTGATVKLGLGSSAAVTVAVVAALCVAAGGDLDIERDTLFGLALAAHRRASGGGSGADIAAITYGGVVRVTLDSAAAVLINERAEDASGASVGRQPGGVSIHERAEGASGASVGRQPGGVSIERVPAGPAALALVYSGAPADTRVLIDRVGKIRRTPERAAEWAPLARGFDGARRTAEAAFPVWAPNTLETAVREGRAAMQAAADAAEAAELMGPPGVPARVAALADRLGAEWKTTGAGGGDLYWLVPRRNARATAVPRGDWPAVAAAAGLPLLDLPVDPQGVRRCPS